MACSLDLWRLTGRAGVDLEGSVPDLGVTPRLPMYPDDPEADPDRRPCGPLGETHGFANPLLDPPTCCSSGPCCSSAPFTLGVEPQDPQRSAPGLQRPEAPPYPPYPVTQRRGPDLGSLPRWRAGHSPPGG
jgi:hypothetical protein